MIVSGSHVPGVDPADFGLVDGTALRYERPADALQRYFFDYHVLDSEGPAAVEATEWMLPSWPAIRVILADKPIRVRLGDVLHDPMPVAALYGTTSRAMALTANGGVTVGASITPLGWARLFAQGADAFRDHIVPLDAAWPPDRARALVALLRSGDGTGTDVKAMLDAFFAEVIGPPSPYEADIATVMALLADDRVTDLESAARAVDIHPARLRRLSTRFFGFPPKPLLMRARFLRSFVAMLMNGTTGDYSGIAGSYADVPHFLRDADRFLGMTPRRFLALPSPYLRACLRARALVMGAPTQALER